MGSRLATAFVVGRLAAATAAEVLPYHATVTWPETTIPRGTAGRRAEIAGSSTLCRDSRIDLGSPAGDLQYAIVRVIKRARRQNHFLELHTLSVRFVAEGDRRVAAASSNAAAAGAARPLGTARLLSTARSLVAFAVPTGTAAAAVRSRASRMRLASTTPSRAAGVALSLLLELFELKGFLLEELPEVLQCLLPRGRIAGQPEPASARR